MQNRTFGPCSIATHRIFIPIMGLRPCLSSLVQLKQRHDGWRGVQVGKVFTPADAIALGVKAVAQADVRRLAATVTRFLDNQTALGPPLLSN
jgi:hypothetical protein